MSNLDIKERDFTKEALKFTPCAEGVAVICHAMDDRTTSGIYIANSDNEKFPAKGTIVATSKEAKESGYEIGDIILYNNYLAEDVDVDGVVVDILLTHNVLGKILL